MVFHFYEKKDISVRFYHKFFVLTSQVDTAEYSIKQFWISSDRNCLKVIQELPNTFLKITEDFE